VPDSHETIIRLDHGEGYVEIWSQDRAVLRKLDKAKCPLSGNQRGQEWRRVPIDRFRWRIVGKLQKKPATEAQLAALAKARIARGSKSPNPTPKEG